LMTLLSSMTLKTLKILFRAQAHTYRAVLHNKKNRLFLFLVVVQTLAGMAHNLIILTQIAL
ncbi:hypothetical protein LJB97_05145, partial [Parabacteroides sp. OttesenSCG-928-O15]|nr:hypothetical protein [Parabacteroides sp. OttesenSCG-928-O15]